MYYIILILATILTGTAIGAILYRRSNSRFVGAIVAVVLGIVTVATGSWIPLAIGTAIFLIEQAMQRDAPSRT